MLYAILFYSHYSKVKSLDSTSLVTFLYLLIAVSGVVQAFFSKLENVYRLWPFLYLFFMIFLFLRPILFDTNLIYQKLKIKLSIVNLFLYICSVSGLIVMYYYSKDFISVILYAEFGDLRQDIYSGEVKYGYTSQLERLVKLLYSYSFPIALLSAFYKLALDNKTISFLIFFCLILMPKLMFTVLIASRGDVIIIALNIIIAFLLFKKGYSRNTLSIIKRLSFVFGLSLATYFLIVTFQRFGSDDSTSSMLAYLSQPMLNFNYGITDSIVRYANGDYFFGWLRGIENFKFDEVCGTHVTAGFVTFIGQHYMDFGPIITFVISIIIPSLISLIITNKQKYGIAELYVFSFYMNYLLTGAFWTTQNVQAWIMALATYLLLKFHAILSNFVKKL